MSVSPLSSNSAALDLLTGGLDGSTASAALTGQGGAAAADPNFEDALFSSSNGDPSLSQAAYANPGLASELSALQALADPTVTGDPLLDGSGGDPTLGGTSDPMLGSSSTVPGQVNPEVLAAYQMAGALTPNISGDDSSEGITGFNAFAQRLTPPCAFWALREGNVRELVFSGHDAAHGEELRQSDSTTPGTRFAADLYPGRLASYPSLITPLNGAAIFAATRPAAGTELFRYTP